MITWNVILSSCLKRTHFPPATISVKHALTSTLKDIFLGCKHMQYIYINMNIHNVLIYYILQVFVVI